MKKNTKSGFTAKRARQQRNSDFSVASERREKTRLCGFTLIEALVAVTILTLATAGPLFSASRALVAAQISRDRLVASYLAQEGVEYVRAMRDDAFLTSYNAGSVDASEEAWEGFVNGSGDFSIRKCGLDGNANKTCTLDPSLPMCTGVGCSLESCGSSGEGNECEPLYLSNGTYTQQQIGTETVFTRTIQADTISSSDERITSTVSWDFHGTTYSVVITDHLTPWQ